MDIRFNGAYRQARSGLLYKYEATFSILGVRVTWRAIVTLSDERKGSPQGSIDITQGDVRALAKDAVTAGVKSWIESVAE